jgi:hypothetical protein
MKGIENVKYFDPKKLREIAVKHVRILNKRVTVDSQDAEGTRFPAYSKEYAELKARGFTRTTEKTKTGKIKKKQSRLKGFKNIALNKQTNPPNFLLRGLTMKNLRDRSAGRDFYEIGWDGEAAAIVEGNASRGRDIMSGIPGKELQQILVWLGGVVDEEWKTKIQSQTIVI